MECIFEPSSQIFKEKLPNPPCNRTTCLNGNFSFFYLIMEPVSDEGFAEREMNVFQNVGDSCSYHSTNVHQGLSVFSALRAVNNYVSCLPNYAGAHLSAAIFVPHEDGAVT